MNDSFENFKQKSKEAWGLGNYRTTAADIPPVSAHLLRLVQIQPGDSVLDVACGYGNTAITARRKGAKVTGIDLTPRMLAQAKEEEILAEVNGIEWREGDVEGLPFEDGSFDIVLSSFGHMFAPSPDIASKEMISCKERREDWICHLVP